MTLAPQTLTGAEPFTDFAKVIDASVYRPLPGDWWVGVTDVVGSTQAIGEGRYKAVNMAGASAISAAMNALGGATFPYAFGGDGAGLAVPPEGEAAIREALSRVARWSKDELGLELRAALVPLAEIRAAGHDVLVAYYAPSDKVRYAMFSGGGMEWAEEQLKAGDHAVAPAPDGAMPDLSGLSCRWKPIRAQSGVMASVIVRRAPGAEEAAFMGAVETVVATVKVLTRGATPVTAETLEFGSPMVGFDLEACAMASEGPALWCKARLLAWRLFAWGVVKSGLKVGGFEAARYKAQSAINSDFRKFHDGLDMTLDCSEHAAGRLEALLDDLEGAGVIRYGLFRQDEALMTCIVPSYVTDDHFHFIDGAGGGYAEAARRLKAQAKEVDSG